MLSRAALSSSSRLRSTSVGGIARFDGLRVSGIDEDQPTGRVAQPHRRRQLLDQRTQRRDLALQRLITLGEVEQFTLHAAGVFEPQHRAAGDGAALGLDRATGQRRERHRESFAARAQRLDGPLHGASFAGIEPRAERQHAMRRRDADDGGIAFDDRLIGGSAASRPSLAARRRAGRWRGRDRRATPRSRHATKFPGAPNRARARTSRIAVTTANNNRSDQQHQDRNLVAVDAVRGAERRVRCRTSAGCWRAPPEPEAARQRQ